MSISSVKFPITKTNLKSTIRKGLTTDNRIQLWPILSSFSLNQSSYDHNLNELLNSVEKLSLTLNEPLLDFKLQDKKLDGKDVEFTKNMITKLSYVLSNSKLLPNNDFFTYDVFLRIIISILQRLDICYMITKNLLSDKDRFIDPSCNSYNSLLYSFKEVLNKVSPKTCTILKSMGALEDKFLDMIFIDFFVELLPPDVVLIIIDSYMYEGVKILIRFGISLILSYKSNIKNKHEVYHTATNFWHHVKADAVQYAINRGTPMLYKQLDLYEISYMMYIIQLGLIEKLPVVDPFALFSIANNPSYLNTSKVHEEPWKISLSRSTIKSFRQAAPKVVMQRNSSISSFNNNVTVSPNNNNGSSIITPNTRRNSLSPAGLAMNSSEERESKLVRKQSLNVKAAIISSSENRSNSPVNTTTVTTTTPSMITAFSINTIVENTIEENEISDADEYIKKQVIDNNNQQQQQQNCNNDYVGHSLSKELDDIIEEDEEIENEDDDVITNISNNHNKANNNETNIVLMEDNISNDISSTTNHYMIPIISYESTNTQLVLDTTTNTTTTTTIEEINLLSLDNIDIINDVNLNETNEVISTVVTSTDNDNLIDTSEVDNTENGYYTDVMNDEIEVSND